MTSSGAVQPEAINNLRVGSCRWIYYLTALLIIDGSENCLPLIPSSYFHVYGEAECPEEITSHCLVCKMLWML